MARIQITDLDSSDFGSMEELTDEELLEINGGRWQDWAAGALFVGGVIATGGSGLVFGVARLGVMYYLASN
jgi:lactobin A/cerein 7B family class IIb bacteriocin